MRRRLSGHIAEGFERELIYRIRLPDGTRRWVRDTCAVVRDITGKPIAVQGTLADITALKEAELERAEIDRRYRRLLENADLLAVILSASGHVEMVNDCFVRLTGFTREEAMGADGFQLILPEGSARRCARGTWPASATATSCRASRPACARAAARCAGSCGPTR